MYVSCTEPFRYLLHRTELGSREMPAHGFQAHGKAILLFLAHKTAFF